MQIPSKQRRIILEKTGNGQAIEDLIYRFFPWETGKKPVIGRCEWGDSNLAVSG